MEQQQMDQYLHYGDPEGKERERGRRTCEEIIAGKFPNLEK